MRFNRYTTLDVPRSRTARRTRRTRPAIPELDGTVRNIHVRIQRDTVRYRDTGGYRGDLCGYHGGVRARERARRCDLLVQLKNTDPARAHGLTPTTRRALCVHGPSLRCATIPRPPQKSRTGICEWWLSVRRQRCVTDARSRLCGVHGTRSARTRACGDSRRNASSYISFFLLWLRPCALPDGSRWWIYPR